MKKKLLIVSLFVLMFCLSACSKEVVLPENFDINSNSNIAAGFTSDTLSLNEQTLTVFANDAEDYYKDNELGVEVEVIKSLCSGTLTAISEAGKPVSMSGELLYSVSGIKKDIVTITVPVQFEKYTVYYEYTFEPNPKSEYNPNENSYILTQAVVSTQYTMGELMKEAGMNTLMGMGVVFLVLIFISFIISLFKYLPGSGAKKQAKKEEEKKPVAVPVATKPAASENLMDNQELVAVITAAVMAASGEGPAMVSSDKLIVRSIKRVSR